MALPSIPELDRRLREERGAFAARAAALRDRLRGDLRRMAPREQLRRHPGVAFTAAAFAGIVAGRIAGGLLRRLRR